MGIIYLKISLHHFPYIFRIRKQIPAPMELIIRLNIVTRSGPFHLTLWNNK